jgi:prepilin-type N-terminal cleavage/methylation domain-containing protein
MNDRHSRGFTLFETMIVLLILGVMLTIGFPLLKGATQESRLSGAVDEVVTALEYARITAMGSGGNTRVTIDDSNDSILVEQFRPEVDLLGTETELNENDVEGGDFYIMGHPMNEGMDYQIILANEERFGSVDILSSVFGSGDNVIFDSSGVPSSAGSVTIRCGDYQTVITIDGLNGKITLG